MYIYNIYSWYFARFVIEDEISLREHWQKTFVTRSRFWLLRGWREEGLSGFIKKWKICDKNIFFSDNVEWSSKSFWIMYKFFQEVPSKLEIQCKKGMYFSFDFGWYSVHLDRYCPSRTGQKLFFDHPYCKET